MVLLQIHAYKENFYIIFEKNAAVSYQEMKRFAGE